ncbi:cysteine desulfurase [Candidatus Marinimicrobia bacterium]|nr:cysteine desulfurase [Candidatus Neomarinimicrobiota bacterium]|tara:strand:- start:3277 stop:4473 length:1197 start_codon:yes stop_codon:yes gene_type:complete
MSIIVNKSEFPIFKNRKLTYLDSASTSQKPKVVLDAMKNVYENSNANVHRALYDLGSESTELYESSRELVAKFINANSSKEIIFTSGATASINLLAYSIGSQLKEDDEVLISHMEHHANIVPWQQLVKRTGIKLKYLPLTDSGEIDLSKSSELITAKTKIVSITHMSNVLGTINPIKEIAKLTKMVGAVFIVDGAQSVSHMPVNVQDLECDFLVFSGHKMLGPTGVGVLWGKFELLNDLDPFLSGGEMIEKVTLEESTWNEVPYKFEAGTPNYVQAIGLGAAVKFLSKIGMENIHKYEKELTSYAVEKLQSIPNLNIHGSPKNRGSVISFNIENIHPQDLAQFLNEDNICIRVGHHCAQPLLETLNETSTARASFYIYNDFSDIDKLVDSIKSTISYF